MPRIKRIRVKGLRSRFRVTLYSQEGTYVLSVPKSRLGYLLLPVARAHPFEVRLKSAVSVDVPRGVKPVGKTARKSLTYTPLRLRKTHAETQKNMPAPKIEEVTSAVSAAPARKSGRKGGKKKAVATVATAA
jgi:hypothetical protein